MVAFKKENQKKSGFVNYPKLKLTSGERARIAIIDEEPVAAYVHNLEAVIVDDYGTPVMKTIEFKNGGSKTVPKVTFVASYRCMGDFDTLEDKGSDPENCPMCAAAVNPDTAAAFSTPNRKFAIHILRYKLNPNSTKVQTPFQVDLEAWVFPNGKFDRLVEVAEEHGSLNKKDLLLGPCDNELFQKFDIQASGGTNPEWAADSERQKYVAALLANRHENLIELIGRLGTPADLALSMREVTAAWETAFPKPSVTNNLVAETRAKQIQKSQITSDTVVDEFLKGAAADEAEEVVEETEDEANESDDDDAVDISSILAQFQAK